MRDPVLLPSSKTIVDRSTIKQHYLSDATDPFNRVALAWEDITDATELKAQIDAFLSARRANRGKPEVVTDDDTKMDL
jgi:ubiquitin conjugation factor E4 B